MKPCCIYFETRPHSAALAGLDPHLPLPLPPERWNKGHHTWLDSAFTKKKKKFKLPKIPNILTLIEHMPISRYDNDKKIGK